MHIRKLSTSQGPRECAGMDSGGETVHPRVQQLLAIPQPAQRSEEWFQMRKGMLTASDLAAAIHLNPYESQFDLLLKKCNIGKRFEGNAATAVSLATAPPMIPFRTTRENACPSLVLGGKNIWMTITVVSLLAVRRFARGRSRGQIL